MKTLGSKTILHGFRTGNFKVWRLPLELAGGFSIQGQCLLNVIDSVFEFVDWPGSVASFFFIGLFYPGGRRI
jgi:hypothetical protein